MIRKEAHRPFLMVFSIVTVSLLLVLSGCSSNKNIRYSGFLDDYSDLEPDPDFEGVMVAKADAETLKKYKKFIIEPVSFYLSQNTDLGPNDIDPEVVQKATSYLHDAVIKDLSPDYPVVNKPGVDVARLRFALTAVELNRKDMGVANYIPVGLVITGIGEATGMRDRTLIMSMEGIFFDSITGRELTKFVQQKGLESPARNIEEVKQQDMLPVLDVWATRLKEALDLLHEKK